MARFILTIITLAGFVASANAQIVSPADQAKAVQALHAAVEAACPDIEGVNSNKVISFSPKASPECRAKAEAAAKSFAPPK